MNRLSKISFLAVVGLLACVLAVPFALSQSAGTAQGDKQEQRGEGRRFGERHWDRGGWMGGGMFSRLNLTDAQKDQIKQLNKAFRDRTQSLRNELRSKHEELRQAENGTTFNEALATQKLTEMASLQAKLMGEQFKLKQEMSSVLTAEQKKQLEQMREAMKTRREQFRSKRAAPNQNQ